MLSKNEQLLSLNSQLKGFHGRWLSPSRGKIMPEGCRGQTMTTAPREPKCLLEAGLCKHPWWAELRHFAGGYEAESSPRAHTQPHLKMLPQGPACTRAQASTCPAGLRPQRSGKHILLDVKSYMRFQYTRGADSSSTSQYLGARGRLYSTRSRRASAFSHMGGKQCRGQGPGRARVIPSPGPRAQPHLPGWEAGRRGRAVCPGRKGTVNTQKSGPQRL